MTCDNCGADALYTVSPRYRNSMNFCEVHIPDDLRTDAASGLFPVSKEDDTTDESSDS
jgi:hypothetical protein